MGPRYVGVSDSLNRETASMNPTTSTRIPGMFSVIPDQVA